MNLQLKLTAVFLIVLALFPAGCGSRHDGPARFSISGQVTLDGEPLESGSILFVDPAGQIQSNFATIREGAYQSELEQGTWKVQITAIRESKTQKVPDGAGTSMVPASEQYIPAKYNEKTELQIEVNSDRKQEFPFVLNSK